MTPDYLCDESDSSDPLLALMLARGEDIDEDMRHYNHTGCSRAAVWQPENTNVTAGAADIDLPRASVQ